MVWSTIYTCWQNADEFYSGPVVRTAPNELSFNSAQSWKDIYDFRQGHLTFIKSEFYDGGSFADQCGSIVSERDPKVHGVMRKYLSHAFSQRSLTEQEYLVSMNVESMCHLIDTELNLIAIFCQTGIQAHYASIAE